LLEHGAVSKVPPPSEEGADAASVAKEAGLRYALDDSPGISRRRRGRGFSYRTADGRLITDSEVRERLAALAIPPAWKEVWISPHADAHLLATGRDQEGRKQYIYHPAWREARDVLKFRRVLEFGRLLPRLRRAVGRDLGLPGLPRRKVLAAAVRVLDSAAIRVGNEEYEQANQSFGLTTLRRRHLVIEDSCVRFAFDGKGGKSVEVRLTDRRLAKVLRLCDELAGYRLFQYEDESGARVELTPDDVNAYLAARMGEGFTGKDFRTWKGTVEALSALAARAPESDEQARAQQINEALEEVAEALGNTARVARESYVHPVVVERFLEGDFARVLDAARASASRYTVTGRRKDECLALAFLDAELAD
jgi:DNA topoisomerase-1